MAGSKETGKKAYKTMMENLGEEGMRDFHKAGGRASRVGNFGKKEEDKNGMTGRERARIASINYHKSKNHHIEKQDEENSI
jgi:hypothetical protein